MAKTPQAITESTISDEAYSLLDSFVGGLDDIVYDVAMDLARKRHSAIPQGTPIPIEVEDIGNAATMVAKAIKQQIEAGVLPQAATKAIDHLIATVRVGT